MNVVRGTPPGVGGLPRVPCRSGSRTVPQRITGAYYVSGPAVERKQYPSRSPYDTPVLSAVAGLRAKGAEREVVTRFAVGAERVEARTQPAAGVASILIYTRRGRPV